MSDEQYALPPPTAFGAPDKFNHWRAHQEIAVAKAIDSSQARFIVQVQPTGSGKSLCYMMAAVLSGKRALILTSTKALQDQIMSDFGEAFKLADVRGQGSYVCLYDVNGMTTVEDGPCHSGMVCPLKENGCLYFDALRRARIAKIVVSNYAFWLTSARYGETIGKFDLLILDEAHDAPEWVMKSMSASINEADIMKDMMISVPKGEEVEDWKEWANVTLGKVEEEIEKIKREAGLGHKISNASRNVRLKRYERNVGNIVALQTSNMVVDRTSINGYCLVEPITAIGLSDRLLFRDTPRIVLTSATIRPKTMWMMGLTLKDQQEGRLVIEEYPSQFEVWRRPVIYVPTVRVQYDMSEHQTKMWVTQIDNIIRKRLDRKGIIHSVSYSRMRLLLARSEFAHLMVGHDTRTVNSGIKKFREMDAPGILVSPSISTGYDFPSEQCEYCIICKVPFPDSRGSSLKARVKNDPEYAYYITMQSMVQASGRGMRSKEDQCEVFVVDDNWGWFVHRYKKFAPKWFLEACRSTRTIPNPPPVLHKGGEVRKT